MKSTNWVSGNFNDMSSKGSDRRPYKVEQTPDAGRILVATRDIKVQEKIMTDEAPIVAPILFRYSDLNVNSSFSNITQSWTNRLLQKLLENMCLFCSGQVNFQLNFFCIQCFKLCLGNKKCPRCKLPICDKTCAKNKTHVEDCPVLRDMFEDEDDPNHENATIEERFQHLSRSSLRFSS